MAATISSVIPISTENDIVPTGDIERVLQEIIDTEKLYLSKLELVIEIFLIPLRESNIVDANEIQLQFGPWDMIYGIHKDLYDKMVKGRDSNNFEVGKLLNEFSNFLRIYKTYVANFGLAMNRRATLILTNKKFGTFLEKCRSDPRCSSGVEALMIIPIQRIPRYRLLLVELLKCTPQTSADFEATKQALNKISDLAIEMNDYIGQQENKRAIMDIMMSIDPKYRINLLDTNRRFIKSGILKRQTKRGDKDFMFWLFTDKILYGEYVGSLSGASYTINRDIQLHNCRVAEYLGKDLVNAFAIESTTKSFIVLAKTPEEKQSWIQELTQAVQSHRDQRTALGETPPEDPWYQPIWVNDFNILQCQSCQAHFKMLGTKAHCRGCGVVTCEECCQSKIFIPHFDPVNDIEVCQSCYNRYLHREGNCLNFNPDIDQSGITKEQLQSQLKHRNDLLRQLHQKAPLEAQSNLSNFVVNNCALCTADFSLMKPKQTCMNCGSNVCGECSRRKFLIPYVNPNKESRVCNDCYFFLVSGADALVENSVSTAAVSATNRNSVATSPRYRVSMSSTNDLSVDRDDLNSPFDLDRFLQIKQDVSEDLENRNSAHNNNSYNGSSKPLSSRIKIPSIRFKAGTLSISTDLSPISTPNNSGKKCQVCSCEFSVFKPKQICKNCGNNVCGDCNRRKGSVNDPTVDTQVCDTCYFVGQSRRTSYKSPTTASPHKSLTKSNDLSPRAATSLQRSKHLSKSVDTYLKSPSQRKHTVKLKENLATQILNFFRNLGSSKRTPETKSAASSITQRATSVSSTSSLRSVATLSTSQSKLSVKVPEKSAIFYNNPIRDSMGDDSIRTDAQINDLQDSGSSPFRRTPRRASGTGSRIQSSKSQVVSNREQNQRGNNSTQSVRVISTSQQYEVVRSAGPITTPAIKSPRSSRRDSDDFNFYEVYDNRE